MTYVDPDSEEHVRNEHDCLVQVSWLGDGQLLSRDLRCQFSTLGRETTEQVVLEFRLRKALGKLNPGLHAAGTGPGGRGTDEGPQPD